MSYQITIFDKDMLNKLFSVYCDKTTENNYLCTYILISKIDDCEIKVIDYYEHSDLISFYQLKEINDNCIDCDFYNGESITVEFDNEEDALYFKLKYGG